MKQIFLVLILSSSTFLRLNVTYAGSFTLVDDITKETYVCSSGGGIPNFADCLARVQKVCESSNWYSASSGLCYSDAGENCTTKSAGFANCVESAYSSCVSSGWYSTGNGLCYHDAREKCN